MGKISSEFERELKKLEPTDTVKAVIMVKTGTGSANGKRQSRVERKSAVAKAKLAVEKALPAIDKILKKYNGKRMSARMGSLGGIKVRTTPSGIRALARSRYVDVVMEDQRLVPIPARARRR